MIGPIVVPGLIDGIIGGFATALLACLDALVAVITDVLLVTPDVTALPQVQALTGRSVWIVDTVFVLALRGARPGVQGGGGGAHHGLGLAQLLGGAQRTYCRGASSGSSPPTSPS